MDRFTHVHKKAFIALLNERRNRVVVDTRYKIIDGSQKLMLVFENGTQEVFKGLRAA